MNDCSIIHILSRKKKVVKMDEECDSHPLREVTVPFVNYTQRNNLAMLAVRKVTKNAVPKVITTLSVAHFSDLVSL